MSDLFDIRLDDPRSFRSGVPHAWFRRLRAEPTLHFHSERNGPGFWCVVKHADVEVVSRDPQTFSSALGGITIGTPREELLDLGRGILSNMDPPEHTKLRRIVSRVFTPNAVSKQQAHIRRLAQRAVRDVSRRRSCEFVTQVAAVLPLRVICEMMGVPHQDRHHLFELSNQVVAFDDPDLNDGAADKRAFAEIFRYALDLAKTYDGSDEENLTTLLLRAEVDGERLSEFELASFFLLLIMAGNETTRNVLTHAMRLMIENPDQWERLKKDRSLVISAVEEVARCEPGVLSFRRTATRDVTLRGAPIRAGDKVVMWYPSANRDEEVFRDPDRFDVSRHPNPHLAFGSGQHFCLGANLARLQLRIMLEAFVDHLRAPRLTGPVVRSSSNLVNGIQEMQVGFEREEASAERRHDDATEEFIL